MCGDCFVLEIDYFKDIKRGDYVSFDYSANTYYKVLDLKRGYILVEEPCGEVWERVCYICLAFRYIHMSSAIKYYLMKEGFISEYN